MRSRRVGLSAGHVSQMLGVEQPALDITFEREEDGSPVDAGGLRPLEPDVRFSRIRLTPQPQPITVTGSNRPVDGQQLVECSSDAHVSAPRRLGWLRSSEPTKRHVYWRSSELPSGGQQRPPAHGHVVTLRGRRLASGTG
jgi:hypothetical protein